MGWASGSYLLEECWKQIAPFVKKKDRVALLVNLMDEFANEDCDTLDELRGMSNKKYPEVKKALELYFGDEVVDGMEDELND